MKAMGIDTICFNWMAHIGWLRTSSDHIERGGARVTEFNMADFKPTGAKITSEELWANYESEVKTVLGRVGGISIAAVVFDGGNEGVELNAAKLAKIKNFTELASSYGLPFITALPTSTETESPPAGVTLRPVLLLITPVVITTSSQSLMSSAL